MIRLDKAREFVTACEARLEQELKLLGSLYLTFPPIQRLDRAQLRHAGGKLCIDSLHGER
jgi:hypothetical protein